MGKLHGFFTQNPVYPLLVVFFIAVYPPSEVWPLLWHYSTHVFPSYIAYIIYNVCISYIITQFCSLSPATILWKPESRFYHLLTFGTTLQDTPNSQFTNIAWKSSIWDDDMTLQGNRPQNFNRSFLTRCLVKTSRNTRDFLGRGPPAPFSLGTPS